MSPTHDHLVAAAALGFVERAVGQLEQLLRRARVDRERGDPGAGADGGREVALGGGGGGEVGDRAAHALGHDHAVGCAARHQHGELLAAESGGDVGVALLPRDRLADAVQQPVAGGVAVLVVEALKRSRSSITSVTQPP